MIYFVPSQTASKNDHFLCLDDFQANILISDITSAQKKMMHNETGQETVKMIDKSSYMYDFFLQFHLSALNGMVADVAVATVFFRLSHQVNDEVISVQEQRQ